MLSNNISLKLLAIVTLLNISSYTADWSSSKFEYLRGDGFALPGNSNTELRNVIALAHASGNSYGGHFFFFDIDHNPNDQVSIYGEYSPAISLGKVFDLKPGASLLRDTIRDNPNLDGVTYQTTIAWSHPIQIAKLPLVFDGFVDWALEEGDNKSKSVSNLHAQPALVADISALWDKPNLLMLGMEYLYWKNKFGIEGLDENIPQLLIRSIFLNKKGSPTPGAFC